MSNVEENIIQSSGAVVAKTDCYELHYYEETNRIYFAIKSYWKNADVVPDLLKDLHKTVAIAQEGFALLADFSAMVTHPQQLNSLHIEAHKILMEAGFANGAYVEPTDKIAKFQIEQIVRESQINLHRFGTLQQAEEWLDHICQ